MALPRPPTLKSVRAARLAEKLRPCAKATWLAEAWAVPASEPKVWRACSALKLSTCWISAAAVALLGALAKLPRCLATAA